MGSDVSKELEITSILRVGSDRGAQLVVVNNEMVAKIYALYYSDTEDGFCQDVLRAAQGDHSREAAAYNQLQKSLAAKNVTPTSY
jgi:hypothetical protein